MTIVSAVDEEPIGTLDRLRLRAEVEDYLYSEAELLDQWRLHEWLELFAPDGRYLIDAIAAVGDVTDEKHADDVVALALERWGRLDISAHAKECSDE